MTEEPDDLVRLGPVMDVFAVTGRGFLITVPAPFEMSRDRPEIKGRRVAFSTANGDFAGTVLGVERFMPATPIRRGEHIGLLVEIDGIDSATVTRTRMRH